MIKPLRIGIITGEFVGLPHSGGIGTAMTGLALCLAKAGHQVTICYTRGFALTAAQLRVQRTRWEKEGLRFDVIGVDELGGAAGPLADLSYVVPSAVLDYCERQTFDLIHFNDMEADGLLALCYRRLGLGLSQSVMAVGLHSPRRWIDAINQQPTSSLIGEAMDVAEQAAIASPDILWSPSRYLLDWIEAHGYRPPKSRAIQPYVLPPPTRHAEALHNTRSEPVTELVFFGRLERRKGLFIFLDALDAVAAEFVRAPRTRPLSILFLGHDTQIDGRSAASIVAERAERWPFSMRHAAGLSQPEALALLAQPGRLAIIASPADNSPCTVYETMEAGIPFVAARSGGIPELIDPEQHGDVLFDPNPDALADTILRALEAPSRRVKPQRSQTQLAEDWLRLHDQHSGWPSLPPQSRDLGQPPEAYALIVGEGATQAQLRAIAAIAVGLRYPPAKMAFLAERDASPVGEMERVRPCDLAQWLAAHRLTSTAALLVDPCLSLRSAGVDGLIEASKACFGDALLPSLQCGRRRADAPALDQRIARMTGCVPTGMMWIEGKALAKATSTPDSAIDSERPFAGLPDYLLRSGAFIIPCPLVVADVTTADLAKLRRGATLRRKGFSGRALVYALLHSPVAPAVPMLIATGRKLLSLKSKFRG